MHKILVKQYEAGKLELSTYNCQIFSAQPRVFSYIGDCGFEDIDGNAINKWLTQLAKDRLKQGAIQPVYSIPSKVYSFYERITEISHNPFECVRPPKKDKLRVTYLEPE